MPIYPDIYVGPPKHFGSQKTKKKYIALHSTENTTASARDEASYAQRRTDSVSSHYYADDKEVVQSLDTDLRAFHAGNTEGNSSAISYEFCGRASWSRKQWLENINWAAVAKQMRRDLKAHNIEPRDLSLRQIKDGKLTGLITHYEMRDAWGGTDHWDPGPDFPIDHLISLLKDDGMSWDYRGIDYVNSSPSTKDHQVARAHEYTHRTIGALFRGSEKYSTLDTVAYPGTEEDPRPTGAGDPERKGASWRYAIQRIWRYAYWAFRRIVRVESKVDAMNAKIDALAAAVGNLQVTQITAQDVVPYLRIVAIDDEDGTDVDGEAQ